MSAHTPTPWFASEVVEDDWGYNVATIGPHEILHRGCTHVEDAICEVSGVNHDCAANAEFIARAANSHYELVSALKAYRANCQRYWCVIGECDCPQCTAADIVLAKVEA